MLVQVIWKSANRAKGAKEFGGDICLNIQWMKYSKQMGLAFFDLRQLPLVELPRMLIFLNDLERSERVLQTTSAIQRI